jgi:hypothetical protein
MIHAGVEPPKIVWVSGVIDFDPDERRPLGTLGSETETSALARSSDEQRQGRDEWVKIIADAER